MKARQLDNEMLCETKGSLESSFELTRQTKRQLTLICFGLRRFAAGIEYSIILPSVYFYLKSFNVGNYFLGLVLTADTLVAFCLSPLVQLLCEKWQRIRLLGFLANLFQIGGSMVYALSLYFYLPLVGRLISGVGQSFSAALYAEVKFLTSSEERGRVMIYMEGIRLFGVVIGPGMNFFVKDFDLTFGPWVIDERTAPGFFMAIIWLLIEAIHIFTVYDLRSDPTSYRELRGHDDENGTSLQLVEMQMSEVDDEQPQYVDDDKSSSKGPTEEITTMEEETGQPRQTIPIMDEESFIENVDEMLPDNNSGIFKLLFKREIMLILVCQFVMFFNQTSFEILVLLVGVNQLDFDINILSTIFIVAGVEMVAVIILVWSANQSLDSKYLLHTSVSAGIIASFARLAVAFSDQGSTGCLVMSILMGIFTIIGTPTASIAGKSILPKLTHPQTHVFYQTAFATSQHLGLITGSLVTSVLYHYLIIFSSVVITVLLVVYLLLLPTVEKMKITARGCGTS